MTPEPASSSATTISSCALGVQCTPASSIQAHHACTGCPVHALNDDDDDACVLVAQYTLVSGSLYIATDITVANSQLEAAPPALCFLCKQLLSKSTTCALVAQGMHHSTMTPSLTCQHCWSRVFDTMTLRNTYLLVYDTASPPSVINT